jgi:glycosyltransferase involved in cell wall biosynthesis
MPVYNGACSVSDAVESILKQTFTDIEFIIVDDGSTDGTWRILKNYATLDSRISLRRNHKNLGVIETLNKGLFLARGKFIARQDADDISLPERLEKQVSYLQRHKDVGILGTGYYRLYSEGQSRLHQPPLTDTEIRWRFLFGNIWPHPSVMFRRELFKNGEPFYRDFLHAEDYELWLRLLGRTHAATLPAPLVIIRTHESDGVSAENREEQLRMVAFLSAQQISELLPSCSLSPPEIDNLYRCYRPERLDREAMAMGRVMFQLLQAFAQQPDIDLSIVKSIRRQWIKRLFASITVNQIGELFSSGLIASILRYDPISLNISIFNHLPRRTFRSFASKIIKTH